jgi:hypothetical protein
MKTLMLFALLLAAAPYAAAADKKPAELAKKYNVTEKEVADLRAKKLGWGEIDNALAISRKSGKPLSEIMAMRDSGMGWGQIAKKEGFTLGEVKRSEKADRAAADRADRAAARADKAAGRGDKGHGRGGEH